MITTQQKGDSPPSLLDMSPIREGDPRKHGVEGTGLNAEDEN